VTIVSEATAESETAAESEATAESETAASWEATAKSETTAKSKEMPVNILSFVSYKNRGIISERFRYSKIVQTFLCIGAFRGERAGSTGTRRHA
jgi:hypothetical protein